MRPRLIAIAPREHAKEEVAAACDRLARCGLIRCSVGDAALFVGKAESLLPFVGIEGAIVGSLFGRPSNDPVMALRSSQCLAIEGSDGRCLPETFWGGYAALWRDRRSHALSVFRDASGALPLFHCRTPVCDLIFSDLNLAIASGLIATRIDWGGVAHALRYRQLPTERTGLAGISEVLPGQSLTLDESTQRRRLLWSPWAFTPRDGHCAPPESPLLADIVTGTIAAWGSRFAGIQLELSGGLDSSIIAHCLAGRSSPWRCVTIYTPGADGDERPYANRMAAAASAPVTALAVTPEDFDLFRDPVRLRPRPGGFGVLDAIDRASGSAATACGAEVIFSGTGGDNVFCYILSPTPVIDAYRTAGFAQARKTVVDIAELSGTTGWTVARHAVQRALLDVVRPQSWPSTSAFLGPALCPPLALHPWLHRPQGMLPGSRTHIASILRIMPLIDAFDRAVEPGLVFPLMAQPIVEACLAIPSWCWMQGGRDRAAVRDAFADRLPREVTARRSKGRLESAVLPSFERSRAALNDLLASGHLARNGIIDISAIEKALRKPVSADDFAYTRILELVDAELWASSILSAGATSAPQVQGTPAGVLL